MYLVVPEGMVKEYTDHVLYVFTERNVAENYGKYAHGKADVYQLVVDKPSFVKVASNPTGWWEVRTANSITYLFKGETLDITFRAEAISQEHLDELKRKKQFNTKQPRMLSSYKLRKKDPDTHMEWKSFLMYVEAENHDEAIALVREQMTAAVMEQLQRDLASFIQDTRKVYDETFRDS